MAITPVQNMLLGQIQGATPPRALQQAFNTGAITADELAQQMTRPSSMSAQVRAMVGGQMTPGEFTASQGMAPNSLISQMSDDLARASSARSPLALGPGRALNAIPLGPAGAPGGFAGALNAGGGAGQLVASQFGGRTGGTTVIPGGTTTAGTRAGGPLALGPGASLADDAARAGTGLVDDAARAAVGLTDDAMAAYGNAYAAGLGTAGANTGKLGFMARLKGGVGLKSGLVGAGLGMAGLMGSGMVDQMNLGGEGSTLDNYLTGGIGGAGVGAGIGSMFGPMGTAIGGAGGFFAGGIYKALTGDTSNKEERITKAYTGMTSVIQDLGTQYGLNSETMQNVMLEYDAAARIMMENGDEEGLKQLAEMMQTSLPSTLMQYRMEQEQEKRQTERMLAIQTQFAPIFQSIVGRSGLNAEAAYTMALDSADSLAQTNPQLASLVRSNAANTRSSADATMAAYASQAALGMSGNIEEQMAVAQNTMPVSI